MSQQVNALQVKGTKWESDLKYTALLDVDRNVLLASAKHTPKSQDSQLFLMCPHLISACLKQFTDMLIDVIDTMPSGSLDTSITAARIIASGVHAVEVARLLNGDQRFNMVAIVSYYDPKSGELLNERRIVTNIHEQISKLTDASVTVNIRRG